MNDLRNTITSRWDNVIFLTTEQWLDCLHYQETRDHYIQWLARYPHAVTYVIEIDGNYSMGAQYGTDESEYISPYGSRERMARHF